MVNISENLEVLEGVKDDIKTAIENKGIVINDTTPFVDYATKINEISIGTGDYQDGYEQGKLDQKALLENRTFRRNGTYSRPDGYGTVVVDVPSGGTGDYDTGFENGVAAQKAKLTNITITTNGTYTSEDGYGEVIVNVEGGSGGDCEEAYEQGKVDQKALLTSTTINRNGTYASENGWNEVNVNVFTQYFGPISETLYSGINDELQRGLMYLESYAADMWEYVEDNPDVTSNGMMYSFGTNPIIPLQCGSYYCTMINMGYLGLAVWGEKTLVTPWVYNANNSPSKDKVIADVILGGFHCPQVEYINRVFEGAENLEVFTTLTDLGKSFTSVNTLDLSVLTKLNSGIWGMDSFVEMANSVYDFAVDGMNVNGISYSNVKLPTTVSQEAIDAWIAKGWRVLQ